MVLLASMNLREYLESFPNQAAAADAFGVSQGTISHWITGKRRPKPDKAREIVKASRGKVTMERIYAYASERAAA